MSESMKTVLGMFYAIICLWGAFCYLLTAISHHRIARRRGICPVLAWIPMANIWLHGRLSDQYQYLVAGRHTKRAATLVTLTILAPLVLTPGIAILASVVEYLSRSSLEPGSLLGLVVGILLVIAGGGLCLAWRIVGYVADYSIYRSCAPDQAKAYVALGIFFPFLTPFFRLACSGRDYGMPTTSRI